MCSAKEQLLSLSNLLRAASASVGRRKGLGLRRVTTDTVYRHADVDMGGKYSLSILRLLGRIRGGPWSLAQREDAWLRLCMLR